MQYATFPFKGFLIYIDNRRKNLQHLFVNFSSRILTYFEVFFGQQILPGYLYNQHKGVI